MGLLSDFRISISVIDKHVTSPLFIPPKISETSCRKGSISFFSFSDRVDEIFAEVGEEIHFRLL